MEETNKNPEEIQVQDTTSVGQVDVDIDQLFGMPGADNVMLPEEAKETEKPKTMFSKENVDLTFIDKADSNNEPAQKEEVDEAKKEVEEATALELPMLEKNLVFFVKKMTNLFHYCNCVCSLLWVLSQFNKKSKQLVYIG